jgi:hypothetical protein
MPKVEFNVREHGGLFVSVEDFAKAQEFIYLAADLFGGSLDFTILRGIPYEGAPPPVLTLEEAPNYSIWVFPKGRPRYEQAYMELGCKLVYLARLMAWPLAKYPLEVIPCGEGADAPN